MSDLSQLSNEDLLKIAQSQDSPSPLAHLSDEELYKAAGMNPPETSFTDKALGAGKYVLENYVAPVGRFVDKYTGAPTRAAVGALEDHKNPIAAFYNQFGENPELAPTGKEIAKKAGIGETSLSDVLPSLYSQTGDGIKLQKGGFFDPTASGAAGLAVDLGADWTNFIPVGAAAKALGKGGAKATELAAQTGAKAADLVTGTEAASKALEGIKNAGSSVVRAVEGVTNPQVSKEFPKFVEVAKKNGIDPSLLSESLEFGPGSFIARASKNIAEGPAGEALLQKYQKGAQEIGNAVERKAVSLGAGIAPDAAEAGSLIRKSYDDAVDKLFSNMDVTYDSIRKYAPGLYVDREELGKLNSSLNGVEKYAKGLISRGITKTDAEQGRQLLRAVNAVRATNGSYKQTVEALQMIGRSAFKSQNVLADVPADIGRLRQMYGDISNALIKTVEKHVSPDLASELTANNKTMSEFFGNKSIVAGDIGAKTVADEQVFSRLFGNTKKVEAMKNILSPESFQSLKGAYLKSLIKTNADDQISFKSTLNALKNKEVIAKSVFSPQELQDVTDLLQLGANYGDAVLSHSGTGASHGFLHMAKGIKSGVINQSVVDNLKNKARTTYARAIPDATGLLGNQKGEMSLDALQSVLGSRLIGKRENRPAQLLKGAQVLSVPLTPNSERDQARRRRIKALGD